MQAKIVTDFKPITQDQFQTAIQISRNIQDLLMLRNRYIRESIIDKNFALPSSMWTLISLYRYFIKPSYDLVNTLRLHTFPFTDHYLMYSIRTSMSDYLIKKYRKRIIRLPGSMIVDAPAMLGEIGWRIDNHLINEDTLMYQKHINRLYYSGIFRHLFSRKNLRVLEIGPGYGGLAYSVWKILKPSTFYCVDLPEALIFSGIYLSLTTDTENNSVYFGSDYLETSFVFWPNFLSEDLVKTEKFDFIINTGSLGEMNEIQVAKYVDIIFDILSDDGIFYEQNSDCFVNVTDVLKKKFIVKNFQKARIWAKSKKVLDYL